MANIKTTYSAFREWLIWVRKNDPKTANCTVSYLRNLESNLLATALDGGKLSTLHTKLIAIDKNINIGFDLESVVEQFNDFKKEIDDEIKNTSGTSKFGLETLKNWARALNSYMGFLCDVTDCFTPADAKKVNSRFGVGGKRADDSDSTEYQKRLTLFLCGVHKTILSKIGMHGLTDQILDSFHEVVNMAVQNSGMKKNVPTELLVNTDYSPSIIGWRSVVLDGIGHSGYPEKRDIKSSTLLQYAIRYSECYNRTDELSFKLFENVMHFYRELSRVIDNSETAPIQVDLLKQIITTKNNNDALIAFDGNLLGYIEQIYGYIYSYSRLFEVEIQCR